MPIIHSIDEANKLLQAYVPQVAKLTGQDSTLDRNRPLMAALGHPECKLRVVHIAGTSGKTSTAYFTAALLHAADKKVGLTVSPHIDSVTERVQINGTPLSDAKFCEYLGEFLQIVEEGNFEPTYFELLTSFSFWVFVREGVDYAVLETGLGGRFDTTNLAERQDKLCIITDIGYDHMNVLGNTLSDIAYQKAGIIHTGNDVIMYEQSDEIQQVFERQSREVGANLHTMNQNDELKSVGTSLDTKAPEFQQRNWLLAHAAYNFLRKRQGLPELSEEQLIAVQQIQVPGRMDVQLINSKTIIMDGAHNGQKIQTFTSSFRTLYPDVRPVVLVALKTGKEPEDVAPLLVSLASKIIITEFATSQDLPVVSFAAEELAAIFRKHGADDVEVEADRHKAYELFMDEVKNVGVIIGSFYLLSQIRSEQKIHNLENSLDHK
jgi:dihydrofolate synthase/folylpolyglutamate synthase